MPIVTDWLRPLEPTGRPKGSRHVAHPKREPVSFERAVERFAEHYVSRKTGEPFSVTSRRNVLNNLLGSPLTTYRTQHGITTVDKWNGDHAAQYLRWLQQELRRDSATIKKVRSQLRSLGEFCDEHFHTVGGAAGGLATYAVSPETDYDRPKDPPLTRTEADTLLRAAPTHRDRVAIAVLLYTGMRPSELLALEVENIRLDQALPLVEIRGSLHNRALTPRDSRYRDISLTIGQTWLPRSISTHLEDPERPPGATRVFLSKRDAHGKWQSLTLEGLRAMLFDLGQASGIKCSASRFRHTFCTWCADAGLQMLHLQRLLGLKNPDMVAYYYQGKTGEGTLEAASLLRF